MKFTNLMPAIAAMVLGGCLASTAAWSTRAYSQVVTGTVTASPTSTTIEINHHAYQVKPNSAASKAMAAIYIGETVDMVMDGPPNGPSQVISVTQHAGS